MLFDALSGHTISDVNVAEVVFFIKNVILRAAQGLGSRINSGSRSKIPVQGLLSFQVDKRGNKNIFALLDLAN